MGTSATRAGAMRLPEQGNLLWQLWHKMPRMEQRAFRASFASTGYSFTTFLTDAQAERKLSRIPFDRLMWYSRWWAATGEGDAVLDAARAECLPTPTLPIS